MPGRRSASEHAGRDADVATVSPPIPNVDQTVAVIYLNPVSSPQDEATDQLLDNIRHKVIPETMSGTDVAVKVGGLTAVMDDFSKQVADRLPIFFLVVIGLSFLLLMVVFRSILAPPKAAIMNLLSIAAAVRSDRGHLPGRVVGDIINIGRPALSSPRYRSCLRRSCSVCR